MFHVDFLLPSTFGMIVLAAFRVLALDCSSTLVLLADKALAPESALVDVLDSFDADHPVFLLEVALGNPDGTNVVDPDVMAGRDCRRVGRLHKVVVVIFFLFLTSLSYYSYRCILRLFFPFLPLLGTVLFLLFVVGTLLGVLMVEWVRLLEEVCVNMDAGSLHGSSLHIAERTRQVDACRSEGSAYVTDPAFCGHFCQADAPLVQTNVAQAAEHDQIVVSVVPVSTYLALGVLTLTVSVLLLNDSLALGHLLMVLLLPVCLHVL